MADTFDLSAFLSEISARLVTSDSLATQEESHRFERDRAMVFRIGKGLFAIPLENAHEVLRHPKVTPVPGMPLWVAGVVNLRGNITSVVDLNRFLGYESTYQHHTLTPQNVIVMQAQDQTIGMIVDGVAGIMTYPPDAIESPIFDVEPQLVAYLRGVTEWQETTVRFIDCTALLTGEQIQQFT